MSPRCQPQSSVAAAPTSLWRYHGAIHPGLTPGARPALGRGYRADRSPRAYAPGLAGVGQRISCGSLTPGLRPGLAAGGQRIPCGSLTPGLRPGLGRRRPPLPPEPKSHVG